MTIIYHLFINKLNLKKSYFILKNYSKSHTETVLLLLGKGVSIAKSFF
jgi:hypothetical protein